MTTETIDYPNFHTIYNPLVDYNQVFLFFTAFNATLASILALSEEELGQPDDQYSMRIPVKVTATDATKRYLTKVAQQAGCSGLVFKTLENMLDEENVNGSTRMEAIVTGRRAAAKTLDLEETFQIKTKHPDFNHTQVAVIRGIHLGDIVASMDERYPLRSGGAVYGAAIVASLDPVMLISQHGDMRWTSTIRPETWEVRRRATAEEFKPVLERLRNDKEDALIDQIRRFLP